MNLPHPTLARLLAAIAFLAGIPVQAAERIPVHDLKPLLKRAIEHDSAHGILVGDAAAFIQHRFGARAPIEIDVRTIRPLRDPDCRRLEVTTRQAAVMEAAHAEDKRLTYQLNYCRDGRLPERE
jgi:hypothetical protein